MLTLMVPSSTRISSMSLTSAPTRSGTFRWQACSILLCYPRVLGVFLLKLNSTQLNFACQLCTTSLLNLSNASWLINVIHGMTDYSDSDQLESCTIEDWNRKQPTYGGLLASSSYQQPHPDRAGVTIVFILSKSTRPRLDWQAPATKPSHVFCQQHLKFSSSLLAKFYPGPMLF